MPALKSKIMKFCQVILSNVYPSLPGLPSWLALIKWMKYIRYHILYHILYFTKYLVTTKLYMMVLRRYDNIFGADILHLESPCSLIRKEILTGCTAGNHFLRPLDNSMCFGNRSHRCLNRWGRRSVPVKKHMKVWRIWWPSWRWTWWPTWRWTWWLTWRWNNLE